jgi:hypothetical protein
VINRDVSEFRRVVERIGLLPSGAPFSDEVLADYFSHFYEFVLNDGVRSITADYASETVRRFFDTSGPYGQIMKAANLPPSMVIIQRINLGLYAIFGEMEATANWRRLADEIWPFVGAPPATPMGREIDSWRRRRTTAGWTDEETA